MSVDRKRVLEHLRLARNRVRRGWVQGRARRRRSFCAWGALYCFPGKDPEKDPENMYAAIDMLASNVGSGTWGGLITWNDAEGRTKREVVGLYDLTISQVERRLTRALEQGTWAGKGEV